MIGSVMGRLVDTFRDSNRSMVQRSDSRLVDLFYNFPCDVALFEIIKRNLDSKARVNIALMTQNSIEFAFESFDRFIDNLTGTSRMPSSKMVDR